MRHHVDGNKFDWQFWVGIGSVLISIISSFYAVRSHIDIAHNEIAHIKEDVREIKNDVRDMRDRFVSNPKRLRSMPVRNN